MTQRLKTGKLGHSILSSWVNAISQTARSYQLDPISIMESVGMDPKIRNLPESRYSVSSVRRFWIKIIAMTQDSLFGLEVGKRIQASSLHGLGTAMVASENLAELLLLLKRYSRIISNSMDIELENDKEGTTLKVINHLGNEPLYAASLALIAFTYRQSCQLSQRAIKPLSVTFILPYDEESRLDAFFNIPVVLGAEYNSIRFRYEDIIEPYVSSNPQILRLNEQYALNYMSKMSDASFKDKVLSQIIQALPSERPDLKEIAYIFNMSERTVQRRLHDEGVTFNELIDNAKKNFAQNLLRHSAIPINEIGYSIGFSDISNFNRACWRWFNCSPQNYRHKSLLKSN